VDLPCAPPDFVGDGDEVAGVPPEPPAVEDGDDVDVDADVDVDDDDDDVAVGACVLTRTYNSPV